MEVVGPRTIGIALSIGIAALIAAAPAGADTGALTPQGCIKATGTVATCAGENLGLAGAHAVAVSPDGKSVYATGLDNDAVSIFGRDTATGALTPQGCISDADNFPASGCADFEEGMAEPFGIAVSPDGLDVYVASLNDHAVAHLERDPMTGQLSGGGCIGDTGDFAGCGVATQGGLLRARNLVVAPDGAGVYVASGDVNNGAIVRLTRNPTTGNVSPGACVMITGATAGCGTTQDSLDDVYDIAISADGTSVHAVSRNSGAVFSFSTPSFGSLGCFYDTDNAAIAGCTAAQGLAGARGVAVSPDGKSTYVASGANSALVRFDRCVSGVLTPAGCIGDVGTTACPVTEQGLGFGVDVAVSPDNASVYSVGQDGGSLVRFDRDTATGALTGRGCISQLPDTTGCAASAEGLFEPRSVVVSPGSNSVYVVSFGRQAITRFDRDTGGSSPSDPPSDPPSDSPSNPPSNEVSVRTKKATCKGACKKLKVKVDVAGPGVLKLCNVTGVIEPCHSIGRPTGPQRPAARASKAGAIETKSVDVTGAGTVSTSLKLTKKARKILSKKGKLKFTLQVDFTPTGGTTNSERQTVKVKRKR